MIMDFPMWFCESPMPKTVRRVQDKIVVQFDNVADGLIVKTNMDI